MKPKKNIYTKIHLCNMSKTFFLRGASLVPFPGPPAQLGLRQLHQEILNLATFLRAGEAATHGSVGTRV